MSYISENIKRIRLTNGLKQETIYSKVGISRMAFSNLENGKSNPTSSNLIKIANELNVKINDLIREPTKLHSLRFRSNRICSEKDKSIRIEEEIKLNSWLKNYNFLEKELNCKLPYKLNQVKYSFPVEAAYDIRKILNINENNPINDIINLFENAGIKIYLYNTSLKQNFGMSLTELDGGPLIAANINKSISIERQIFTLAHELGHLILHNNSYKENICEENKQEEDEADIFAANFLMPNKLFEKKVDELLGNNWIDVVLHVKRFFKVSYKTVLRRLVENKYINDENNNIYQKFAIDYNKLYNHDLKKHYEPKLNEDIEFNKLSKSDFMADRYHRLIYEAYKKELITTSKVAELLNLELYDARSLISNWRLDVK